MNSSVPILVDKWLLWAFSAYYAIFTAWGVVSFFNGIRTINLTGGSEVEAWFTLGVALLSGLLAPLPILGWEKIEKFVTIGWLGVVMIYPATLAYQTFYEYDQARAQLLVLSFAYLILPMWRTIFLFRKHRTHNAS